METVMEFRVLGPLEALAGGAAVDLRGPRHREVLARLLVADGRVVPVRRLVDDLWEEPPEGAVGAVQSFVAALRRALEPDRPPRAPARLLVTAAPGYALRADREAVDARRFEEAVGAAGAQLADGRAEQALAALDGGLALWRGPAYAEFETADWARGARARLDALRLLAVERRAEAALALGRAAETVPELEALLAEHPWREGGWRLLALALYRTGRQADALAVLRRARTVLAEELGLDPGPELRSLEAAVLAQDGTLRGPGGGAWGPGPGARVPEAVGTLAAGRDSAGGVVELFGREQELAQASDAAAVVESGGHPGVVLVSGGAGAGKSALVGEVARRLAGRGWAVAWGRSPESDGAPEAWPWRQVLGGLGLDPELLTAVADGDPATARFRAHRAVADELTCGDGPLLIVLEDLHRAGEETLALLATLAAEPRGRLLIAATYRATELTPALTGLLGRTARQEPTRLHLGGLSAPAVGALLETVTGRTADPAIVRAVHARTGGNPFFVREVGRLLVSDGDAALEAVPSGVREVIRHRLDGLPEADRTVLRQASVLGLLGREVELDLLAALVGDEERMLGAVESGLLAGFLDEAGAERVRFAHALVRDALYESNSAPRRARWHGLAAEELERLRPGALDDLAYHFSAAGTRATAPRAARYARAAAEQAERRSAPQPAARLWRSALDALERAGAPARERLAARMGLVRTLAMTGRQDGARQQRAAALVEAGRLGDPGLTARVITAYDVPASWTANDDERLSAQLVTAAEELLADLPDLAASDGSRAGAVPGAGGPSRLDLPGPPDVLRARLLATVALESRGTRDPRGRAAALEAERLARRSGDPAALAFALNARWMHEFHRCGLAPERAAIGAELRQLAREHGLVSFEVLAELILLQSASALGDFPAADRHAAAADGLAEHHDLPVVGVLTDWYRALRRTRSGGETTGGEPADAEPAGGGEAAYRAAAVRLHAVGMPGTEHGLLPLALLSLRLPPVRVQANGGGPVLLGGRVDPGQDWGPYEPWVRPLLLAAEGRREAAAEALRGLPDSPFDLLREARACLAARAAVAVGDRVAAARLHRELLPAAGESAGAGSGMLSFGPVADHLAALAAVAGIEGAGSEGAGGATAPPAR